MSKKWLWIVLAFLGFLGIGGLSGLAFLSYKIRDIKEPLIATLKSYVDGDLKIGNAEVRMFPTGIDLENVTLYAAGETEPSASIKRAEIRFNLLPLIKKKFETRLIVVEPNIRFHSDAKGLSNMERIFKPLIAGESKGEISRLDQLWWRRLAVNKLVIKNANFTATREAKNEKLELHRLNVEADQIRFESADQPAKIRISFELPQVSKAPMEIATTMNFDEAKQSLKLSDGKFQWAKAKVGFQGEAQLPSETRQEVGLTMNFESEAIDLKDLGKALKEPLPASGKLSMKGTVNGTPFAPELRMTLSSPALQASGKTLSNFKAELVKKGRPLEIQDASFGLWGGGVGVKGQIDPLSPPGGDLQIGMQSLSLAAASGNKSNNARLSGNVRIRSANLPNLNSWNGGGDISVGPIPLPNINMKDKIQIAEVLSAGTQMGKMVNIGMLGSSQNVIGSQIPSIRAKIKLAGGNITLAPFSMGNGHFNASGSGTIHQQKSIQASGTFTLNPQITARLFPDANFRSVVTGKKGVVSFPFSASGPLDNPNISVDSSQLRAMLAKATAMGLANLLAGGVNPNEMLNSALKKTPLGDPKNPLSQILGTAPTTTSRQSTTTQRTSASQRKSGTNTGTSRSPSRSPTGNRLADQLLFGR